MGCPSWSATETRRNGFSAQPVAPAMTWTAIPVVIIGEFLLTGDDRPCYLRRRVRRGKDHLISSKALWAIASNAIVADGGSADAGFPSIATTTKVWPLLFVAR